MICEVNDSASGRTRALVGLQVEVLETAPNGRSVKVRKPGAKVGWLPVAWLDEVPERCPTCGQVLHSPLEASP